MNEIEVKLKVKLGFKRLSILKSILAVIDIDVISKCNFELHFFCFENKSCQFEPRSSGFESCSSVNSATMTDYSIQLKAVAPYFDVTHNLRAFK